MPPAVALAVSAVAAVGGAAYQVVQSERAATDTRRAGRARADQLRREATVERERNRRLLAQQRAAYGAAGVSLQGSPLLVQAQTFMDSIYDQQAILAGANFEEVNARRIASGIRAEGIAGAIGALGQVGALTGSKDFQDAFKSSNEVPPYIARP